MKKAVLPPPSPRHEPEPAQAALGVTRGSRLTPIGIAAGVVLILGVAGLLVHRADARINKVALSSEPKPATAVVARRAQYRETHTYIGTLRPWVEANVGPQFVSAYVDTVLVRPGAAAKRNDVLATLDCRNASASSQAVADEARAIDARQKAIADESARFNTLLDGGYVSPNEAEQKQSQSAAEEAQLASQKAKLASTSLAVGDCILRAPFDGEISVRSIDPGAFVRPGASIVTLVDRNTVRMTFDVPEIDFDAVAAKTPVSITLLATGKQVVGAVARRSPAADLDTRTVHVEVDLDNVTREIPVNTTGEVRIQVGSSKAATVVPLTAASISGSKATLFVVEDGIARKKTFAVQGEEGSDLYLETALAPGANVVTEGRALLADGDRVTVKEAETTQSSAPTPSPDAATAEDAHAEVKP
jgi:membrane fusion protein (multidrug efflux system)